MTKQVPVIFHNLKGYDSHLIIREIGKFNVKVSVIPNGLEEYMVFTISNNLIFIDSIQLMNSSLDVLVKNVSEMDFKYLSQEFSGDLLELVKQKGVYPYEYMDSFEKFFQDKLPDRCEFFSSLKDECMREEDYLHLLMFGMHLKLNQWVIIHDLEVLILANVFEKFISTCLE